MAIGAWPVKNIQNATPTDTGGSTATPMSDTMNCDVGGAIFGVAYNQANELFTWTGITEAFDGNVESGSVSMAALAFAAAQAGLTITADTTSETNQALALAALR